MYQETNPLTLRKEFTRAVRMLSWLQGISPEEWMAEAVEAEISRTFKRCFGEHLGEYLQKERAAEDAGQDRERFAKRYVAESHGGFVKRLASGDFDGVFSLIADKVKSSKERQRRFIHAHLREQRA